MDMIAEEPKKTREPVFQNRIMLGQLIPLVPLLPILGTLIYFIWVFGYDYSEMRNSLLVEQRARESAVVEMKLEMTSSTNRLADKIDANNSMQDQKLNAISDKMADMKTTLNDIVKASTPVRR